ncbi:hypothetical protein [Clostridium sp. C8]|uniref:hypothetical protein n=1 Tax=Clostridium sp. C8 TaxID=1667357 RepID=UPI00062E5D6C|nr:hypothetical protein [Clostridium sp. C8]KLE15056.1 hypothetical protein AAT22_13580 [Clostridium sp. C8]
MIKNILQEYKTITEHIVENISNNDKDLNNLMDKREELINELFKDKNINLEEVRKIYISRGLLELDKKLKASIEEEQTKTKEEIKKLHKVKSANNAYEKNRRINSFFNAKI